MRAVVVGIHICAVGAEVVSVDIVDISVAVVVYPGSSVKLRKVGAHVGCKVFVLVVDTAVDDCYHYVALAGLVLPCLKQVDVGAGYRCAYIAEILIMPLLGQAWVVEHVARTRRFRRRFSYYSCLTVALLELHRHYRFRNLYARRRGKYLTRLFYRYALVEVDYIPAVKPVFCTLRCKLGIRWQHRSYRHRLYLLRSCIQQVNTGT